MARQITIQKAVRTGAKARIALDGPAGSGKTWTALSLASVLADGKRTLLLDTEHGEAQLYSDNFDFDVFVWAAPFDPRELTSFLKTSPAEYGALVIDSLSLFYNGEGGLLSIVDAAGERARGNSFAGWKTGTPIQNEMVDTLRRLPCHLVVTMRSKMEYVSEKDDRTGKMVPRKVGLAPIQREGFEYEMGFVGELDKEHNLTISKSRYSVVADKVYRSGHEKEFAVELRDWLKLAKAEEPAKVVDVPGLGPVGLSSAFATKATTKTSTSNTTTAMSFDGDRVSLIAGVLNAILKQYPAAPARTEFLKEHGYDGKELHSVWIGAADDVTLRAMSDALKVAV